jgi:hypothetical protein
MVAPRGRELLDEDGWVFVRIDGQDLHLFKKGNKFVYYNPSKDTFSKIMLFDPKQKNPQT